jgi:ribosome biogenesis GTPase
VTRLAAVQGEVIAAHGRHYLVEVAPAELRWCVTRGRRSDYACGDQVLLTPGGVSDGVIESALARTSLFSRSVEHRTKLLAANPTQLAITVASEPSFSDELITRAAINAHHQGMKTLIVLNKCDLPQTDAARERLHPLLRAGYPVISLSALADVSVLRPLLAGERTVLMGQSGMGKSTLVNALVPDANTLTAAISTFLDSGRHTTTASRLYRLDAQSSLIDTPGLKEFGLAHLPLNLIARGFPELAEWHGSCRFANCGHRSEPDCSYRRALAAGAIHPRRFELLLRILEAEGSRRSQGH